jgi:hypothetical protein
VITSSPNAKPAMKAAAPQADGSTAVVTPASGAPGMTVTGSGADWTTGDDIQAEWGDDDSDLGSPVVVAGDGTFTDSFAIPSDATAGSHQVLFWDEQGQYFEVANFDVTGAAPPPPSSCSPSVSLRPDSGPVGTHFVLAGTGWAAGGTVTITLPYGSKGLFTASGWTPAVGADGTWQITATVGNSPAGSYTFTFAESGCTSRTGTFTVTVTTPPPRASCSRVWFIGARGSGEPASGYNGMGPEVDHMAKVLAADLAAKGRRTQLLPVFYPADSVDDLKPDKAVLKWLAAGNVAAAIAKYVTTSVFEYDASIDSGIKMTEYEVASVLRLCPGAKIVLAGYSQGAIAVHDAENWLAAHEPGELRHVLGTLLLGDGDRVPNTKAKEFGTSKAGAQGLRVYFYRHLPLVKPQDVPLPRSTANIANADDIVADFDFSHFAGRSVPEIESKVIKAINVHIGYARRVKVNGKLTMIYDSALRAAANWVASRVLAGV